MITQALVLAVVVVAVAELGVAERQQLTKRLMPQALAVVSRWFQASLLSLQENSIYTLYI